MLNIPIDQIARHMETHKNQPIPLEYAEILMGELQQAHREGWEQCQREAKSTILDHFTCCDFTHGCDHDWCNMLKEIADAIAAMEYGGKAND